MKKLSYEEKIELYFERKEGIGINELSKKYQVNIDHLKYMIRLIDLHGLDIIRENKNKFYTKDIMQEAINRVINNKESIRNVAIDLGMLSHSLLTKWVKLYKENGYNIVEGKRGRSTMPKVAMKKENETDREKIKRLEKENLYLKAELEYSKKLRAVVQTRKNQQQKKK